jgi:hypothetical protein
MCFAMRKQRPYATREVEPAWVANTTCGRELAVYGNHDEAQALSLMAGAARTLPRINGQSVPNPRVVPGTLRWDTAARPVYLQDGRTAPGA